MSVKFFFYCYGYRMSPEMVMVKLVCQFDGIWDDLRHISGDSVEWSPERGG